MKTSATKRKTKKWCRDHICVPTPLSLNDYQLNHLPNRSIQPTLFFNQFSSLWTRIQRPNLLDGNHAGTL
ncbi:MAG: hypothetical protein L0K76_07475, partial [Lentilactobacillus parabuchneri]|nr:hypothetical protein [Lentilactobacillus parabuchneri]